MSKIHITLVGGQPMPVYLGIKYCSPDNIIFIYSKETEKQKQIIKKEFDGKVLKSDPLDPVNMDEIEAAAKKYAEKYSNDEITLNISGGTKAWAYYFSKIFEEMPNAKIIYVDQNNVVYDLKSKTHEKVDFDFMMQFKLNKNPLQSYTDFEYYTQADFDVISKIEEVRKVDIGIFTNLTNIDRKHSNQVENQKTGMFQVPNGKIIWDKQGSCHFEITKKDEIKKYDLESSHIVDIVFNASWFELKIARILSEWDKANHVYMNCKFLVNSENIDIKQAEKTPKNEVDIIVDTGDKALFIECKTNIANSTDIDKFNTVVKNYGGNGSKSLFVCLNKFGDKEKEKIRDCNMLSYSLSESGNIEDLYALLDRNIYGINK